MAYAQNSSVDLNTHKYGQTITLNIKQLTMSGATGGKEGQRGSDTGTDD